MSEYTTVRIPEDKVKNLKKALKSKGINARSNAEAINVLIDSFLLKSDFEVHVQIEPNNNNNKIAGVEE